MQSKFRLGKTISSIYGVPLVCNFDDATFRMYVAGTYGRFYWNHLSRISYPFVFVDIGANQGLYTLCAAKNEFNLVSHAFEPNKKTYDFLKENIRISGNQNKCEAHNVAISDIAGCAELRLCEMHSGGASLAKQDCDFEHQNSVMNVRAIDHRVFDEIMEATDVPIIVKVDVEGFELTVLRELMNSRHANRIAEIFYEVDEAWVDQSELRDVLESGGFTQFEKIGGGIHYDVLASR